MTQEEIKKIKLEIYSERDWNRVEELEHEIKVDNLTWLVNDEQANKE